ncbi:MAG: hypothetical protein KatS3mg129_3083 [Leptospiraceae bacterium]|nr:MAG: hypothetical protein KatS3mg129_3083 [Leptospiraceae bacterium]
MKSLQKFREEIDHIDKQIVELILKRAEFASEIGKYKKENHLSIYKPDREVKIYENIKKYYNEFYKNNIVEHKFPLEALLHIYRELMSGTIQMEGGAKIGYLGPPGSFSHVAVQAAFWKNYSINSI